MILGTIWHRSGLEDEKQALILPMTPPCVNCGRRFFWLYSVSCLTVTFWTHRSTGQSCRKLQVSPGVLVKSWRQAALFCFQMSGYFWGTPCIFFWLRRHAHDAAERVPTGPQDWYVNHLIWCEWFVCKFRVWEAWWDGAFFFFFFPLFPSLLSERGKGWVIVNFNRTEEHKNWDVY